MCIAISIHAQDWKTYPYSPEGSILTFPNDEGRHASEPVEWWYVIGHVVGEETGTNYSFMLTYFYADQPPYNGFRILNLSNDDTGEFYDETQPLVYDILSEDSLNIKAKIGFNPFFPTGIESWKNKVDEKGRAIPFEYSIEAKAANGALNIELVSTKRPLILGGDGKFDQGLTNYTYYYSQTGNTIEGALTFKGLTENVTGTGWIDRQYGTFNPYSGEKYEWFCLQLDNGMDINVWSLFTFDNKLPDNDKYKHISVYVDDDSSYTTTDFELERLAYAFTDDMMKCYSQKWRLTSPHNDIDLTFDALHSGTEVNITAINMRFYEGASTVQGKVNGINVNGQGFAELLHAYEHPVIEIYEAENPSVDRVHPIRWSVENKDDGRPLFFDLSYAADYHSVFQTIATGLMDTFYVWSDLDVPNGQNCKLKVFAYSIDTTLHSETISDKDFVVDVATSVQNNMRTDVRCFPNPAKDVLYVSSSTHKIQSYSVFDMGGRKILKEIIEPVNGFNIKTDALRPGIYVIKVNTLSGNNVVRFVKN